MTVGSKTIMVVPKKVSVDAAIASVISELESISSLKEEQRTALKAFLDGKYVLVLLCLGLDKNDRYVTFLKPMVAHSVYVS